MIKRQRTLGLVVPAFEEGGGVPAVARFLRRAAIESGSWKVKLVSLVCAARDPLNVSLSDPRSWWRGAQRETGVWEGVPFTRIGAIGGEFEFQRYRPRKLLRATLDDCEVIQVVCGSPAPGNAVLGLGKPVSLQCATRAKIERHARDKLLTVKSFRDGWRRVMTRITDHLDARALKNVDAVQVENEWMFDFVREVNRGRTLDLRYAPPGVDVRVFTPIAGQDRPGDPYILCVGRLNDRRKNVSLLVEAYVRLPYPIRSKVRLVLAGSSSPPPEVWSRIATFGLQERVLFIERPSQESLVKLYQGATVFALPSYEEGLGVVVLEAMACGIPVVATRCGGPEGIISDGTDGFLVPLNDAQSMSDRLARLCSDEGLKRSMGRAARHTVERRYAEDIAAEPFLDTWNRLARSR